MKLLVYPQRACGHKLNHIIDYLGIEQTNDTLSDFDYAIYFNHNHDKEEHYNIYGLNSNLLSTDKKTVESVFCRVFFYTSFVKEGRCVEKTIYQADKSGHIIDEPLWKPNHIYQKVLGQRENGKKVEYRITIIDKEISVVWKRTREHEFKTSKDEKIQVVASAFSKKEVKLIEKFAKVYGLDFADLDVLRDEDGKMYIIDVNNTSSDYLLRMTNGKEIEKLAKDFEKMLVKRYRL